MFKPGEFYIHRNMLDAAILVTASLLKDDGSYDLGVRWFLQRGLSLNIAEMVTVKEKDIKNWELV